MVQISLPISNVLKYFVHWFFIGLIILGIAGGVFNGQFGLTLGCLMLGVLWVSFSRAVLLKVRKVVVDSENKELIVGCDSAEIIPFADVQEILIPWTPPYVATVKLTRAYTFGDTFTFAPTHEVFRNGIFDPELMARTRR